MSEAGKRGDRRGPNAEEVLRLVREYAAEHAGEGPKWAWLMHKRIRGPLIHAMVEIGLLRDMGERNKLRFLPGREPEGLTVRQLTAEELERVRRGELSYRARE